MTSDCPLQFQKLVGIVDQPQPTTGAFQRSTGPQQATVSNITRARVETEEDFDKILKAGKPVIVEGADLGTCVQSWTAAYLIEKVGSQRKVSI